MNEQLKSIAIVGNGGCLLDSPIYPGVANE